MITFYLVVLGMSGILSGIFLIISSNMTEIAKNPHEIANDLVNVRNIKNIDGKGVLYTKDGYMFTYIKIDAISIDLYSEDELMARANLLSAAMSREKKPFNFSMVPQNVDIQPVISNYNQIKQVTNNDYIRNCITKEQEFLAKMATDQTSTEKLYYYSIWEKYSEGMEQALIKRAEEFRLYFINCKFNASVMTAQDIAKVCRAYSNSAMAYLDNGNRDKDTVTMTMINELAEVRGDI